MTWGRYIDVSGEICINVFNHNVPVRQAQVRDTADQMWKLQTASRVPQESDSGKWYLPTSVHSPEALALGFLMIDVGRIFNP